MAENRRGDARRTPAPSVGKGGGQGHVVGWIRDPRGGEVDHALGQDRTDSDGFHGQGHLVLEKIAVATGGGA